MDASVASAPPRSLAITVVGWLLVVASALLSIVSFMSLLMFLAGSHGTQSADVAGFLLIVVAPPATCLAGIGLVMRWRWAFVYCVLGLLFVLGWQAYESTRPPPAVTTTLSPGGVRTTLYYGGPRTSLPLVVLCVGLIGLALTPRVRREFFAPAAQGVPAGGGRPQTSAPPGDAGARHLGEDGSGQPGTSRDVRGALMFMAMLLGVAGFTAWLSFGAMQSGSVTPPYKGGLRTVILRAEEPIVFWVTVGVYSAVSAFALAFVILILWHALRPGKRGQNR